ncbi:MAG: hypothetical protein EBZ77_00450 [Chitinophagia bacterium]|nr:hypothetical protein [Chitinophagia bacterium]
MKSIFFVLLLGLSQIAGAETFRTVLNGKLIMETGEQFPYRLELVDSAGGIYGYSYTFAAPNDTKAAVVGKLDRVQNVFTYKETSVEYARSLPTKAFLCLVNARLPLTNGRMAGSITTRQADNTSCSNGRVVFDDEREVAALFASNDKYDMTVSMGGKKVKPVVDTPKAAPMAPATESTVASITAGITKSYDWQTDSIVLEIWDGGHADGDMVTVSYDNKVVIGKYTLYRKKRRIVLPVVGSETHTLSILAEAEGDDPPTTASVALTDGELVHNLLAYNNKGAISVITIKKARLR